MRAVLGLLACSLLIEVRPASADWKVTGRIGGSINAVAASGSVVYVGVGSRLHLYDVTDPAAARELGSTISFADSISDVFISGSRAYVGAGTDGIYIVDIADPAAPRVIGRWDSPGTAEGVAVDGALLYVADGPFGLQIVDVSNPSAPAHISSAFDATFAFDVAIQQPYAYVAGADAGLLIVDVRARESPLELGIIDTPGFSRDVAIDGSHLYLADEWGGVRVFSIAQPSVPREIASVTLPSWAFGVAIAGSTLHVADGAQGLRSIDISDPAHPRAIGALPTPLKFAWKVAVANGRAFLAVKTEGVHVIDLAQPASPRDLGLIAPIANATAVAVRGDFAYALTADQGMFVIDLSQPDRLRVRGAIATLQGSVSGLEVVGDRFVYAGTGVQTEGLSVLDAIDVNNPDQPTRASRLRVANITRELVPAGSMLYMPDEFGLEAFDVSNAALPVYKGRTIFSVGGGSISAAVAGTTAFVNASAAGLTVVDVSDPANMRIVANWSIDDGPILQVAFRDNFLFVTAGFLHSMKLVVLDVRDPTRPVRVGSAPLAGDFTGDILLDDSYAYVANGGAGVAIIDVRNPARPVSVAQVPVGGFVLELALKGDSILAAASGGGLVIIQPAPRSGAMTLAPAAHVMIAPPPSMSRVTPSLARSTATRSVVVTTAADSGPGSLREALSNHAAGDVITFDPAAFPPKSPATIRVETVLPHIKFDGVVIDASNAGVILDGSRLTGEFDSGIEIDVTSKGNTIKGMQIVNFPSQGININGNGGNTIGGDRSRGSGPSGEGNVLSLNKKAGVSVENQNKNRIIGNLIGTDVSGRAGLGTQRWGVNLFYHSSSATETTGDRVGGDEPWEANVIAGNVEAEVSLHNGFGNTVVGNFIGVDAGGNYIGRSGATGVSIDSSSTNVVVNNVIVATHGAAIIGQGACCNRIMSNYVGVSRDGRIIPRQIVGGTGIGSQESFQLIAGNEFGGIQYEAISPNGIEDLVAETIITGNSFRGRSATQPVEAVAPVAISAATRTFISANRINAGSKGIELHGGVDNTFIFGNSIGNDDKTSMQNTDGVDAGDAHFTFIQNNTIANNSGRGVIAGAALTRIRRNAIYGNRGGAIVADKTPAPVITSVTSTTVNGMACARCVIEIFSDEGSQGGFYEGTALADPAGRFTFTKGVSLRGPKVTATATDTVSGNTSALSAAVAAPPPPPRHRGVRH